MALDCARSAIRLGAEVVEIYYRRSRQEMPAIREEVEEALREGIGLHELASPTRIRARAGKIIEVEFIKMRLAEPDPTGRPKPVPIKGSEFRVRVDTVLSAVGQRVDRRGVKGFETNENGTIRINPETGATSTRGVFAGGDIVTGSGWAIDAIAAGKRGALSIHRYLSD